MAVLLIHGTLLHTARGIIAPFYVTHVGIVSPVLSNRSKTYLQLGTGCSATHTPMTQSRAMLSRHGVGVQSRPDESSTPPPRAYLPHPHLDIWIYWILGYLDIWIYWIY